MIREFNENEEWKQINYRFISIALGIEFLHDLYNRHFPNINSLRFRNTITYCKGSEVISYAPKKEWNFIAKWFGEKFIRGDQKLWKEIEDYIKDPKERLSKLLRKIKETKLEEIDNISLGLLLIDFHYTVLNVIYKI